MSEYNAKDDGEQSYLAAIEAKRLAALAAIKREVVIGDCRLLLGDCLEILPAIGAVDLCLADPPYGIGASGGTGKYGRLKFQAGDMGWDEMPIGGEAIVPILSSARQCIIWGGNYYTLPPRRAFLIWDKGAGFKGRDFAEVEQAWCSWDGNAKILQRDPLARGDYREKVHPTQKPVALMEWCIESYPGSEPARTVLDPFMGSGTTGVACVRLGRKFIGIELNETYFDIAVKRVQDAHSRPDLFIEAARAPEPVQEAML